MTRGMEERSHEALSPRLAASQRQCWEPGRRFPEPIARESDSDGQGGHQGLAPAGSSNGVLWEGEVGGFWWITESTGGPSLEGDQLTFLIFF